MRRRMVLSARRLVARRQRAKRQPVPPYPWRTKDGRYTTTAKMDAGHLVNLFRLMHRQPWRFVYHDWNLAMEYEIYSSEKDWGPERVPLELDDLAWGLRMNGSDPELLAQARLHWRRSRLYRAIQHELVARKIVHWLDPSSFTPAAVTPWTQ